MGTVSFAADELQPVHTRTGKPSGKGISFVVERTETPRGEGSVSFVPVVEGEVQPVRSRTEAPEVNGGPVGSCQASLPT